MLIYTDEDIRLDLLLPAESQIFPKELTAEDRKQILSITRDRADCVDFNGHIILPPDQWIAEYRKQAASADKHRNPQLEPVIRHDVVIPTSGKVQPVDAGIADVIQRLMDRGVVVDGDKSVSGMVTDHPGTRLVHPTDESGLFLSDLKPGEHLYGHRMPVSTVLEFPLDNRRPAFNGPRIAEALTKAALQSGFVVYQTEAGALRIMLPCCMDGTGEQQVNREALGRMPDIPQSDYKRYMAELKKLTRAVIQAHGGMALYTDTMIQDRLSRFGRAVERMFIADRTLGQKQETPDINYSDYLLAGQINDLQQQEQQKLGQLWTQRVSPYIYQQYKESPAKVDGVARLAGYQDYREYMQSRMSRPSDSKRRTAFKQLERQMLHTDSQGMLKLYRINSGISREMDSWLQRQQRQQAQPVMEHHRQCGYPLDKIRDISIVTGGDGKATLCADIGGRMISRPVREDTWVRLLNGACTPFELALDTVGREIGWNGKLNLTVSSDTVRSLDIKQQHGSGRMPLTHDGRVYRVDTATWQHAWLLTRFRQMPESLQKQLLDIHPSRRDVMQLDADELKYRFSSLDKNLLARISQARLTGFDNGKCSLTCTVDGVKRSFTANIHEIELRNLLLPEMDAGVLHRQLLADKLQLNVMGEDRTHTFKR